MTDAAVQVLEEAPEKLCKKCDEPADSEFFYRQAAKPDGLSDICKACYAELPSVQKRNRDKHGRLLSVWEQLDLERTGSNAPMCM
ncbi:hypothetical protein ACYCFK_09085 [Stutzerimonas stutzeri]